jgi:hypothetical protein
VQKSPQPREDQAEIVAYRAQYGVRGVAPATLQIAAAEVAIALMCPMIGFNSGAPAELAFDNSEHAALLTRDEYSTWIGSAVPR